MKIGIDARLIHQTGVGRYIRHLLSELSSMDTENEYVVYLGSDAYESFVLPNSRWQKRLADVHWHTFREQYVLPRLYRKDGLDLLHVPYFTIPLFYEKPIVVTIHDLIPLHVMTGQATQLPFFLYGFKWAAYYGMLFFGLRRAKKIIAVSEATKKEITSHFLIKPSSIEVVYEGISRLPPPRSMKELKGKKYFLYVGNAYPHKNIEMLIAAFSGLLGNKAYKDVHLVFVGKEDVFYRRLKSTLSSSPLCRNIFFAGSVDDGTLAGLYKHAEAFVFPSKMEGFGLPALEALSQDCPLICSDIPVFHEILGDIPLYVHPKKHEVLRAAMETVLKDGVRIKKMQREKAKSILSRFQWKSMAEKTQDIYEDCFCL